MQLISLADIVLNTGSDDGFIHQLIAILLIGLCFGIVYAMGWWFFKRPPIPPMALTIWNGLFILIGGLIVINFLLGLAGHNFIRW